MPFLPKLSTNESVLIRSHILKHDVNRNSLLIVYILNVFCMTYQTFIYALMHSITKKYNFISIVKIVKTFFPNILRFFPNFRETTTFAGALAPLHSQNLYHCDARVTDEPAHNVLKIMRSTRSACETPTRTVVHNLHADFDKNLCGLADII